MTGIVHADLLDMADRPVGSVITVRGKELRSDATVADARRLFESSSVQVIPLLDGETYAGAVSRDDIVDAAGDVAVRSFAKAQPPTATSSTPAGEALLALDGDGGRRLVVLGDDGTSYVGLVCVTRDGARLCIDAECHAGGAAHDRAMALFEERLAESGEGVCISSLPMLAEEVAADVAGDDKGLWEDITAQLRRRAGLHA
jgi:CBS domain-containing protein